MSQKPPTRAMRENPDLDQLKRQAKELLEAYRASSPDAVAEVAAYHRSASLETFALHDIRAVDTRGGHANQHIVRSDIGDRPLDRL